MSIITRRRTPAALAALTTGVLVSLAACGSSSDVAAPTPGAATPAASAAPTGARPASTDHGRGSPTSRPRPRPTTAPSTTRPNGGPTTSRYAELVDVWHTGPSSYALVYDPVDRLTGPAAADYYRRHPEKEPLEFAFVNDDTTLADQLPVAARGTFWGNQLLGPHNGANAARITGDQMIAGLRQYPRLLVEVTERQAGNHTEVVEVEEVYLP